MGHPLLDLTSKTAVVIGGTSGIGFTLVQGLAQAGANAVPIGRRGEHVRAAAAEVGSVEIRTTVGVTEEMVSGLLDRRFDLAFISLPVSEANLRLIPLFDEELLSGH